MPVSYSSDVFGFLLVVCHASAMLLVGSLGFRIGAWFHVLVPLGFLCCKLE